VITKFFSYIVLFVSKKFYSGIHLTVKSETFSLKGIKNFFYLKFVISYFQILTADLKSEVQNILMYKISNVNKPQVNFFFNLGLPY